MFCTNCGKQNPNENRFCQYCGTRMEVAQVASAPAAPIAPAPPAAPAAPAAAPAAAAPVNAAPPAPPAAQAAAAAQVPAAAPAAPAPQAMPVDPQPAPQQYAPAPPQPFVRVPTPTPQPAFPEGTIEVDPVVVSPLFADESEGPRVVRSDSAQPIASEPAAPVPPAPAPQSAPAPAPAPAPAQQPAEAPQPAAVQPVASAAQPVAAQPSVSASAAIAPSSSDASSSAGLTGLSGIPERPNDAGDLVLERENGERLPVTVFPATVGKGSVANVRIANNTAVSRAHLRISRVGGSMMAEDLGSTNHTYLNGERVVEGNLVCLKNGDLLRLGDENIKVEIIK